MGLTARRHATVRRPWRLTPTNNKETWASGPQPGTDRLVIALEMGRSSVKSVITRSLSHYPNVVDGPHPRTSAALAVKTSAGHEAQGPFIVYALLAPQFRVPRRLGRTTTVMATALKGHWSPAAVTPRLPAI